MNDIVDKKILFSAVIWSHLAHSWPRLNFMCKAKYNAIENG